METETPNQSKRGGSRPGAGRKKTTSSSIALRIPADVEQILSQVEQRSAYIVEAIRYYHAQMGCQPRNHPAHHDESAAIKVKKA